MRTFSCFIKTLLLNLERFRGKRVSFSTTFVCHPRYPFFVRWCGVVDDPGGTDENRTTFRKDRSKGGQSGYNVEVLKVFTQTFFGVNLQNTLVPEYLVRYSSSFKTSSNQTQKQDSEWKVKLTSLPVEQYLSFTIVTSPKCSEYVTLTKTLTP